MGTRKPGVLHDRPRDFYPRAYNPANRAGSKGRSPTYADPSTAPCAVYLDRHAAFLRALDAWRRESGCRFPTAIQILSLAERLGWTPPADWPPAPLTRPDPLA
jgi:hypothetical protein